MSGHNAMSGFHVTQDTTLCARDITAHFTSKWFFPSVNPHVSFEKPRIPEPFRTQPTGSTPILTCGVNKMKSVTILSFTGFQ